MQTGEVLRREVFNLLDAAKGGRLKKLKEVNKHEIVEGVTEDYMEAVARAAINMETGARGLKGIVKNTTWPSYDKVKSESGVYREVVLDEKTVSDNKVYVLRKKDD